MNSRPQECPQASPARLIPSRSFKTTWSICAGLLTVWLAAIWLFFYATPNDNWTHADERRLVELETEISSIRRLESDSKNPERQLLTEYGMPSKETIDEYVKYRSSQFEAEKAGWFAKHHDEYDALRFKHMRAFGKRPKSGWE